MQSIKNIIHEIFYISFLIKSLLSFVHLTQYSSFWSSPISSAQEPPVASGYFANTTGLHVQK